MKNAKEQKKESGFIPDEATSSGASFYMKLQKGDNRIRCISKPIFGWISWEDNKPIRTHIDDEPEITDSNNKPKKFMALAVLDRNDDDTVKVMEITQQSVIKAIKALADNSDWGTPFGYDINITKTGEDMKTKYVVTPSPKKQLSKETIKAASLTPCYLDALFENGDPQDVSEGKTEYIFK